MSEQSLILLKPDAIKRNLIGKIIDKYEAKGLQIAALKLINVSQAQAENHYQEHKEKPFFRDVVNYITSGPVLAMVLQGAQAVKICRSVNGATDPSEAAMGSIRGDFAMSKRFNLVHASDSPASAKREIGIFFSGEEILSYDSPVQQWS